MAKKYIVSENDLANVADAIRETAEIDEPLTWPNEYIAKIRGIGADQESAHEAADRAEAAATEAAGYATQAGNSATASANSATQSANSSTQAGQSATNASQSASNAEAWAVGERNGTPVESGDDTYENNAKYYAGVAEGLVEAASKSVRYDTAQSLTAAQKEQARENIGGASADDVNEIDTALGKTYPSANLLDISAFSDGYYASGVWKESDTYVTSDYMPLDGATDVYLHRFNLNNGSKQDTARYIQYIYWFDSARDYLNRTTASSGVTEYDVLSGAAYFRVMAVKTSLVADLANNKGYYVGAVDTETWVEHTSGGIQNYAEIIKSLRTAVAKAHVTLAVGIYTISTAHARYTFSRITDAQKNLDTWRLYSGMLVNDDSAFTMWVNSDAEGAIAIQGETDYVSGYHGSEIMTAIKVFMDGVDITSETSVDADFDTLMFYVESDVYHCYQDTSVANTVAFKRCKVVSFSGNKVTVSNSYILQENLTISSARIALFQCYKSDGNTPVFTDFSVNTDFKNYPVSTVGTLKPTNSDKMTEAILNTTYGRIRFKSILTSGQSYKGSVTDFASQNRVKFYFDTISQTVQIPNGEQIMSQFEFEVT